MPLSGLKEDFRAHSTKRAIETLPMQYQNRVYQADKSQMKTYMKKLEKAD
jgi:ribosomal protein S20